MLRTLSLTTLGLMASATAFGQGTIIAQADNRQGNITVNANPNQDPLESGFNVDPGENELDPFTFSLSLSDARQGCSSTKATATLSHVSFYPGLQGNNSCRGFVSDTAGSASVTVTSCGAGQSSFAGFSHGMNQTLLITGAPAGGVPMRLRGYMQFSGGATATLSINGPGVSSSFSNNQWKNQLLNLGNGEYTISCSFNNGSVNKSTVGTESRAVEYFLGFYRNCQGDLNGDGKVNQDDLNILLGSFGLSAPAGVVGDVDGDGDTDQLDLNVILAKFNTNC